MVVDRALREAIELVHDILDGRLLVALLEEQPHRGVEYAGDGLLGVLVPRHAFPSFLTYQWYVTTSTKAAGAWQGNEPIKPLACRWESRPHRPREDGQCRPRLPQPL